MDRALPLEVWLSLRLPVAADSREGCLSPPGGCSCCVCGGGVSPRRSSVTLDSSVTPEAEAVDRSNRRGCCRGASCGTEPGWWTTGCSSCNDCSGNRGCWAVPSAGGVQSRPAAPGHSSSLAGAAVPGSRLASGEVSTLQLSMSCTAANALYHLGLLAAPDELCCCHVFVSLPAFHCWMSHKPLSWQLLPRLHEHRYARLPRICGRQCLTASRKQSAETICCRWSSSRECSLMPNCLT